MHEFGHLHIFSPFFRWTYGASKGAVHTLTKMMALDLSKDKIRVNSLSPTWTWTPEVAKIDPQSNFCAVACLCDFSSISRKIDFQVEWKAITWKCLFLDGTSI